MNFFIKRKKFCDSAIAYIKQVIPTWKNTSDEMITLRGDDSLVVEQLSFECAINYLVYNKKIDAFDYVQQRHLKKDGYTKEQLKGIGLKNLDIMAKKMMKVEKLDSVNVYHVTLDSNFDAALILLDNLWDDEFKKYIENSYVVAIPARHVLTFCDSKDAEAINYLGLVCKATSGDDHLLCEKLYIRKDAKWVAY